MITDMVRNLEWALQTKTDFFQFVYLIGDMVLNLMFVIAYWAVTNCDQTGESLNQLALSPKLSHVLICRYRPLWNG